MDTDAPVNAALVAAVSAAFLTSVLLLYSLGLRVAHILYSREQKRLQHRWWPILAEAACSGELDDDDGIRELKSGSRSKGLREWCRFRSMINTDSGTSLRYVANELGLLRCARRQLRRRAVGNRLMAIQALGFLSDRHSWARIVQLLEHPNVSISITAATALVRMHSEEAIRLIIPRIVVRPDWPRTQVGKILSIAGPSVVSGPLCKAIQSAGNEDAILLLAYHESAGIGDIDSLVVEQLLRRTDPGFIAAALKAVRGQMPVTILERLTRHDAWFVRMQAATLLGRFGRREDYQFLEPLLGDAEWWVRYRAAQAITRLPFLGPAALRKLTVRQKDRYARDILHQAMAESGLA